MPSAILLATLEAAPSNVEPGMRKLSLQLTRLDTEIHHFFSSILVALPSVTDGVARKTPASFPPSPVLTIPSNQHTKCAHMAYEP